MTDKYVAFAFCHVSPFGKLRGVFWVMVSVNCGIDPRSFSLPKRRELMEPPHDGQVVTRNGLPRSMLESWMAIASAGPA